MSNPTKKINFVAFSDLRPGTEYSDCKDILVSHWRELRAADEGKIWLYKFGSTIRVDVNGIIRLVCYSGSFPKKRVIDGLSLGFNIKDVLVMRPNLIESEHPEENWRKYTQHLDSGNLLTLEFKGEELCSIAIEDEDAVYPKKEDFDYSKYYPKPEDHQVLFKDNNFKLAVISSLVGNGYIDLGKPEELASHTLGRFVSIEDPTVPSYDKPIQECFDYLIKYPLSAELLEQVTEIYIDATCEIYRYIFWHWDGESNEFDVTSLKGCENIPNLKTINLVSTYSFSDEEKAYNKELENKLDINYLD